MSSCLASAVGATFLVLRLAIFLKISYTVKGVIFTRNPHSFHLRSGATTVVLQGVDEKKRKIKPNWRKHNMAVISMKQLLEAGVHFGHQTRRRNPK